VASKGWDMIVWTSVFALGQIKDEDVCRGEDAAFPVIV
jgi:hypothetical protein